MPMNSDSLPPDQIIEKISRPIVSDAEEKLPVRRGAAVAQVHIAGVLRQKHIAQQAAQDNQRKQENGDNRKILVPWLLCVLRGRSLRSCADERKIIHCHPPPSCL